MIFLKIKPEHNTPGLADVAGAKGKGAAIAKRIILSALFGRAQGRYHTVGFRLAAEPESLKYHGVIRVVTTL